MVEALAACAAGYLLGSIPNAAWIARLRGATIFDVGSGNMGAMNMARNLGFALGAGVLVLDVAKGALATVVGLLLARTADAPGPASLAAPLAAGLGVVLGHGFSLYIGFRGGKGLAAAAGSALPLYPWGALAGALLLVVLTLLMRRRSGIAAVITVSVYPALATATLIATGWQPGRALAVGAGVASMAVVVLVRHYLAFRRERRGDR